MKDQPSQVLEYIPRQHRLGLGAKALNKEQLMKQDGMDKRKLTVTENYEGGAVGKNVKGIDEELNVKGREML